MVTTRYFGIRHHGPGSARSLRAALDDFAPDRVLVEGPADAEELLRHVPQLVPPVALMLYDPKVPNRAAFFPFASFSPEWVAFRWAAERGVETRLIDLPMRHQMALDHRGWGDTEPDHPRPDPLGALARAAGFADGERWWERVIEEHPSEVGAFEAVAEAMGTLRAELGEAPPESLEGRREALREAFMRKSLRAAERGAERVAVVVGAWHVPALAKRPPAKQDTERLAKLPRQKVAVTWVPWTHGRLSLRSGYGAGIRSPGWYAHLFSSTGDVVEGWLGKTARLLRAEGFEVSTASLVDAARLAHALAALRRRPRVGLPELTEATISVLLNGSRARLELIESGLIVGEAMGEVPASVPELPLAVDLKAQQRSLRMKPDPTPAPLELDLREEAHRGKSRLLRRLSLLEVPWGRGGERGEGKGSFKETWTLAWAPELSLRLVDAARYGNTVERAAEARAMERLDASERLAEVVAEVEAVLLAELEGVLPKAMRRLDHAAASASELGALADAVPALARMIRFGSARALPREELRTVLEGLLGRLVAGIPSACHRLGPELERSMSVRIDAVDRSVAAAGPTWEARWRQALERIADDAEVAPGCRGRASRRLLDADSSLSTVTRSRMSRALAEGGDIDTSSRWLEGFLAGGVGWLIYDPGLLGVLDSWLAGLSAVGFEAVLPVARAAFAGVTPPERRRLGMLLKSGLQTTSAEDELDPRWAARGLALGARLLGLEEASP